MINLKSWHKYLIFTVIALTIYNILPTVIYYTKPLSKPISKDQAETIGMQAFNRVNKIENESIDWIHSFSKLIGANVKKVSLDPDQPQIIKVQCKSIEDAAKIRKFLPKSGSLIPFYPAQLKLAEATYDIDTSTVLVQRAIPMHVAKKETKQMLKYASIYDPSGNITPEYKAVVEDRFAELVNVIGGTSENASILKLLNHGGARNTDEELLSILSQNILSFTQLFGENSSTSKRFYASFTQGEFVNKIDEVEQLLSQFTKLKDTVKAEKISLQQQSEELSKTGQYLSTSEQQRLSILTEKEDKLLKTINIIKNHKHAFAVGSTPFNYTHTFKQISNKDQVLTGLNNFIISSVSIDWKKHELRIDLHSDIQKALSNPKTKDLLEKQIFNEIARVSKQSGEQLLPSGNAYSLSLLESEDPKGLLIVDLQQLAKKFSLQIETLIANNWNPTFQDLKRENFPILQWKEFKQLPVAEQHLKLVLYSPEIGSEKTPAGFRPGGLYVIAKDLGAIVTKFNQSQKSPQARQFTLDFDQLKQLLVDHGFTPLPGNSFPFPKEFANDLIFEAKDFYLPMLQATREEFQTKGTKRYATLELSTLAHRIKILNEIETKEHEDLLKWKDEYNTSRVDPSKQSYFDVPKPTRNTLASNILLSIKKYFRGDERKVLKWGLDLSGGKTVQVELRDQNNKKVTSDIDIRQGMNELYNRVNKMGVSEVSIRQEGKNITLDFPGAQTLSASELIKASSMYFHVVNEKFSLLNKNMSEHVNRFLQDVWNEAVVTNKKDPQSLNLIAWNHLYGDAIDTEKANPRTQSAKTLYENGLRLMHPVHDQVSNNFDDSVSKIAIMRGDTHANWGGQSHPLMIVFKNYALEGSSLSNVQSGYDTTTGNFLSFEVKRTFTTSSGEIISPRKDLHMWSSRFSKESILGTTYEQYSMGRGYRMAVILNGFVVSSPTLDSPLKDHARITGHFTQREVQKLEADLKAGSLTYTPQILSEKNISPELGIKERSQGVTATIIALASVILTMTIYYRFSGVIASIAVLLNLLIMWAALQNLGAAITLPGIAGIILTVGMAVDANVLVFERIREELAKGNKLAHSISTGYKKAFSAIVDSNITTIIAALILLNFDAGPIKGFAVTLIIGIASSMFTALFFTRSLFALWLRNSSAEKSLTMMNLFKPKNLPFLKYSKVVGLLAAVIMLAGSSLLIKNKNTALGMDFSGGYAINIELTNPQSRNEVMSAFINMGAKPSQIQVRQLDDASQYRLFFAKGMEEKGQPFYGLPLEKIDENQTFPYEKNPRIKWIVSALEQAQMTITTDTKSSAHLNWTSVSGQMSDAMRNNALIGLGIALLCILAYITFRFEFKYAVSATLGLAFDVVVSIGLLGILHQVGVPVEIDLNTVAALMTIIGYSLNDTIIVFDRIREEVKSSKQKSFRATIELALNATLSRTLMTSFTTLIVLIALCAFGGSTVFGFSLIMAIGVVVGTLSTFFVASFLLLMFADREERKEIPATNIS